MLSHNIFIWPILVLQESPLFWYMSWAISGSQRSSFVSLLHSVYTLLEKKNLSQQLIYMFIWYILYWEEELVLQVKVPVHWQTINICEVSEIFSNCNLLLKKYVELLSIGTAKLPMIIYLVRFKPRNYDSFKRLTHTLFQGHFGRKRPQNIWRASDISLFSSIKSQDLWY